MARNSDVEDAILESIVGELRSLRARNPHVKLDELSERSGVPYGTLRNIFRGTQSITATDFVLIVSAYGKKPDVVLARAMTEVRDEHPAVSEVLASFGTDDLANRRRQKAASEMSVEELEGQRHAATRDPELDSDEPDVP